MTDFYEAELKDVEDNLARQAKAHERERASDRARIAELEGEKTKWPLKRNKTFAEPQVANDQQIVEFVALRAKDSTLYLCMTTKEHEGISDDSYIRREMEVITRFQARGLQEAERMLVGPVGHALIAKAVMSRKCP